MSKYYMVRIRSNVDKFVGESKVAVGWSRVNFTSYSEDVDGLIKKIDDSYYKGKDVDSRTRGRQRGQVKRLAGIEKGDIIVVPAYRSFYLGYATGECIYDEDCIEDDLANQLIVDFKKDENGKPMVFAREGKNTALMSKLRARGFTILEINGQRMEEQIDNLLRAEKDYSEEDRIANIEAEKSKEFQSKLREALENYEQTSLSAGGMGFEELVKKLMESDGYEATILSKNNGGSGVADADILAIKKSSIGDEFTPSRYIQAKHYRGGSSNGINQIIAKKQQVLEQGDMGNDTNITANPQNIAFYLISSGSFTKETREIAERNDIILIDGERLAEILIDRIDDMSDILHKLGFYKEYVHYIGKQNGLKKAELLNYPS